MSCSDFHCSVLLQAVIWSTTLYKASEGAFVLHDLMWVCLLLFLLHIWIHTAHAKLFYSVFIRLEYTQTDCAQWHFHLLRHQLLVICRSYLWSFLSQDICILNLPSSFFFSGTSYFLVLYELYFLSSSFEMFLLAFASWGCFICFSMFCQIGGIL